MNKLISVPKLFCALLFICMQSLLLAQPGTRFIYPNGVAPKLASSNTASLTTSYTTTACGLNFTQATVRLNQRHFSCTPATGVVQPATMTVTGLPWCKNIIKAFLYVGVSGDGVAITASLTNPSNVSASFPMSIVGRDKDVCWQYDSTYTYRADVTSIISGNGNYILSGIPASSLSASSTGNDADGATLFIIYSDLMQTYTGSIIIADGCQALLGNGYVGSNITGFNVCANPTLTTCFMLIADLQQIDSTKVSFNTPNNTGATPNYVKDPNTDNVWDYVSAPGTPPVAGQTNANFGMQKTSDCAGLMMAGMYYRTSCLTCVPSNTNTPGFTLSVVSSTTCPLSATVTPVGAPGPFNYNWIGTSSVQNGSVISQPPGTYTVNVTDNACHSSTATVALNTPSYGMTYETPMCKGETRKIIILGPASINYTWTGNYVIPSMTAHTPTAYISPTVTSVYTVSYTTGNCNLTQSVSITVQPCTGIEELAADAEDLVIYPNPARDKITISAKKEMKLQIINALGQCVRNVSLSEDNEFKITVTGLLKGLYYLTDVSGGKVTFGRKIIVE